MSVPLFPYMILKSSDNIAEADIEIFAGIIFACDAVGILFASVIFAYFSDRFSVRKPIMISATLFAASSIGLFVFGESIPFLMLSRFLNGIASGQSWVIGFAIIADRFTDDEVGGTMGLVLGASTIGYLLGPILSGFLFDASGGIYVPMILNGIIVLIDLIFRLFIFIPPERVLSMDMKLKVVMTGLGISKNDLDMVDQSHVQSNYELSEEKASKKRVNFSDIMKEKAMVVCLINIFIYSVLVHSVESILSVYLYSTYKSSLSSIGVFFFLMNFPTFFGSIIGGKLSDIYSYKLVSGIGSFFWMISSICLGLTTSYVSLGSVLIFFGFFSSIVVTPILPDMRSIVQNHAKQFYRKSVTNNIRASRSLTASRHSLSARSDVIIKELRGSMFFARLYALFNIAFALGMIIGPLYSGWVLHYFGFFWFMTIPSIIGLTFVPILIIYRGK